MFIRKFQTIIEGLRNEQLPKLFENLSAQLNFPLNISRMKTGVVGGRILGIDDAGKFIATTGTKLKNGDIATITHSGERIGVCSKEVPLSAASSERGFFENLANQLKNAGHEMNLDRMKVGNVDGKPFAVDDAGNYIFAKSRELHPNGTLGTVCTIGKVNNASSKVVPYSSLSL